MAEFVSHLALNPHQEVQHGSQQQQQGEGALTISTIHAAKVSRDMAAWCLVPAVVTRLVNGNRCCSMLKSGLAVSMENMWHRVLTLYCGVRLRRDSSTTHAGW